MMIHHTAHLRAHPHAVEQYKARLLRHARTSLEREPGGCLRFDVHQDRDDPSLFLLIETYADPAPPLLATAELSAAFLATYLAGDDGALAPALDALAGQGEDVSADL